VAQNSLAVRTINARYLISSEHPEPFALRDRLDTVLRRQVPSSLASAVGQATGTQAAGMLFIRSLDIDVAINAEWDDDQMANEWADAMALALARVLPDRKRDENSAWFASREEYLADYLRQVAVGTASNRWYFSPFDGLRPLPASAALRTALCRDPVEGLAALCTMTPADLIATVRAMTRADILKSIGTLFPNGPRYSDALARTIAHTWSRLALYHALIPEDEPFSALLLCVEVTRHQSRFVGSALTEAARGLVRLERILQTAPNGSTAPLRRVLEAGDVAALYAAVGGADAEIIATLFQWPRDLRIALAASFRGAATADTSSPYTSQSEEGAVPRAYGGRPPADPSTADSFRHPDAARDDAASADRTDTRDSPEASRTGENRTSSDAASYTRPDSVVKPANAVGLNKEANGQQTDPRVQGNLQGKLAVGDVIETSFGGLFLLLPVLDEILPASAVSTWLQAGSDNAISVLRLLIISRCFGYERAARAQSDPLIRLLTGARDIRADALSAWMSEVSRSKWRRLTQDISSRIRPLPQPIHPSILIGSIPSRGGQTAIALETSRGCWLLARGYKPSQPGEVLERVLSIASEMVPHAIILQDESLEHALQRQTPNAKRRTPNAKRQTPNAERHQPVDVQVETFLNPLRDTDHSATVYSVDDPEVEPLSVQDAGLKEQLARLSRLKDDFDYLSDPASRAPSHADLALRVAAQNVLRLFAARLPGFAHSSLPYLHSNFLSFGATMEAEDSGRSVVRISRPPLHLILHMTGMIRATYRLSWLDQQLFALFPET